MKQIPLKVWSAMLPNETKFLDDKEEMYQLTEIDMNAKNNDYCIWACNRWDEEKLKHIPAINVKDNSLGKGFKLSEVKPILYDLSWLTREITHEGETFVPNTFLFDLFGYIPNTSDYTYMQVQVYEKLLEWHFNVFSLPDDLIVKVTETFNPYK